MHPSKSNETTVRYSATNSKLDTQRSQPMLGFLTTSIHELGRGERFHPSVTSHLTSLRLTPAPISSADSSTLVTAFAVAILQLVFGYLNASSCFDSFFLEDLSLGLPRVAGATHQILTPRLFTGTDHWRTA